MDSSQAMATRGLSIRWVEVTDESGRSRLEMRWSAIAAEVPAVAAATPAAADAPVETPPSRAA